MNNQPEKMRGKKIVHDINNFDEQFNAEFDPVSKTVDTGVKVAVAGLLVFWASIIAIIVAVLVHFGIL